ncbi:GumC family protein [Acuticoccus sediminis]|uniref:GumC family protein n=1 Tax=Acuticoccus sediminis TaxID=2184697 RepID=UPI001CFEB6B6|nr:Wzz/FepE/Etk N-terminal domain-containing protein [Acuticoccus sediminis]
MNELPSSLRFADRRGVDPSYNQQGTGQAEDYIDLRELLRACFRQAWVVVLCVIVFAGLAIAYAFSLQPKFTSFATVLLDQDRAALVELISEQQTEALRDGIVQSELEILKSQELALRVVDNLHLVDRPDILDTTASPVAATIGAVKNGLGGLVKSFAGGDPDAPAATQAEADQLAAMKEKLALRLRGMLTAERMGRSYVLGLSVEATSPELAQEIAKGFVDSYLEFGRAGDAAALDSAVAWLRQRTDDLRQAATDAGRELEQYRIDNGLVSVGTRLLSEQEVSELMSQLILAEAEASAARAVAAHGRDAVAAGPEAALANLASLPSSAPDEAIEQLRSEFLSLSRERSRVAERFGAEHAEVVAIDQRLQSLEGLLFDEVKRRATQAENNADVQTRRVAALREGLDSATKNASADTGAQYELMQLQETAESYKTLYQSALTRLERTVNQLSLPIVDARVLTAPDMPSGASSPQKAKYAAIGIVLGGFLGALIGLVRELTRSALKTSGDVRRALGLPVLASVRRKRLAGWRLPLTGPRRDRALMNGLRSMKVAVDGHTRRSGLRTVAFISARPGEERERLAYEFAEMLAEHGISCLLLDVAQNIRRPQHGHNLVDILDGDAVPSFGELTVAPALALAHLPGGPADSRDPGETAMFAGSERMAEVIAAVSQQAQYIVLDLPAASEGACARAFAEYAQTAILVHRTGRASDREVQALAMTPDWDEKLCGAVLVES